MTVQKPESFVGFRNDTRNVRTPGKLAINSHLKSLVEETKASGLAIDIIRIYARQVQWTSKFSRN